MTDKRRSPGFERLARTEGILCALETAHADRGAAEGRGALPNGAVVIVNVSGRGDKDMGTIASRLGVTL